MVSKVHDTSKGVIWDSGISLVCSSVEFDVGCCDSDTIWSVDEVVWADLTIG